MQRRSFLLGGIKAVGFAAAGGIVWSAALSSSKANALSLRPPGAVVESEFLKRCIRCGLCVEACPFGTLKLSGNGDVPLGTPYFKPREVACEMCEDIPCVPICPTNALETELVSRDGKLDYRTMKMGVAVLDHETCLAYWGLRCDACYRVCPLNGEALLIELKHNERTGRHSYLLPVVDYSVCTGCGKCEQACITEKPSIFVQPREVAMGAVGKHYIQGWNPEDEGRLDVNRVIKPRDDAASELNSFEFNTDDFGGEK